MDDLEGSITLVIRGQDLISSTGRQVRLGRLLRRGGVAGADGPWPPAYLHHPLILNPDGSKLSKSTGASGVRRLRAAGILPGEVLRQAALAVGLGGRNDRPLSIADLPSVVGAA